MKPGQRKWIIHGVSILITLIFLFFLFSSVNLEDIFKTIAAIDLTYLGIGFLIYIVSYLLRAIRFRILLNQSIPLFGLFSIVCVHNMANGVLPAKSGELSYVFLVGKFQNIKSGEALATLLIARIFDIGCIIPLFLISFLVVEESTNGNQSLIPLLVLILVSLIILTISLLKYGKVLFGTILGRFEVFTLRDVTFFQFVLQKGKEMVEALEEIKTRDLSFFGKIFSVSLSIWISIFFMNYILTLAMNLNLSFLEVMFASSFCICATMLPIQGIVGFGTFEAGWVVGFMTIGLSYDAAISSGFSYHFITILYFTVLGLIGVFNLLKPRLSCILQCSGNTSSDTENKNS